MLRSLFGILAMAISASVAGTVIQAQGATTNIAGLYRLATIDGRPIPVAPVHPGFPANVHAPEVLASTLILRPDGTFVMAMSYRSTSGGVERYSAQPFSGTYAADGDAWVARWDGAGTTRLTFASDTLTMNNEGMLFAYRKVR